MLTGSRINRPIEILAFIHLLTSGILSPRQTFPDLRNEAEIEARRDPLSSRARSVSVIVVLLQAVMTDQISGFCIHNERESAAVRWRADLYKAFRSQCLISVQSLKLNYHDLTLI